MEGNANKDVPVMREGPNRTEHYEGGLYHSADPDKNTPARLSFPIVKDSRPTSKGVLAYIQNVFELEEGERVTKIIKFFEKKNGKREELKESEIRISGRGKITENKDKLVRGKPSIDIEFTPDEKSEK